MPFSGLNVTYGEEIMTAKVSLIFYIKNGYFPLILTRKNTSGML